MGHKTKKGDISITPQGNGKSRLRFRYKGKRESINIEDEDAEVMTAQIKLEIAKGIFDISKYKIGSGFGSEMSSILHDKLDFSSLYTKWILDYKNGNLGTNSNYSQVLNLLRGYNGDFSGLISLPDKNLSHSTYNRRLTTLSQFSDWLISHHFVEGNNPFLDISKKKKSAEPPKTNREPLTNDEINTFLNRLREDKYGSYYYPLVYFIFRTGVRNEEAIGLRVKYVMKDYVHISEVLARGKQGTNAAYRIRKATKNGKERDIPLTGDLRKVLSPLLRGKEGDDLVFLSPKGMAIDDRQLQNRILKPIMRDMGLGERDLYAARHSFASRAIDQGIPLTTVSKLVGNKVDTLVRHYVKAIEKPTILPKM